MRGGGENVCVCETPSGVVARGHMPAEGATPPLSCVSWLVDALLPGGDRCWPPGRGGGLSKLTGHGCLSGVKWAEGKKGNGALTGREVKDG